MSVSAQALRLYILIEPPDIVWVFDRLRVLDLVPSWLFFRCRDGQRAFLIVHLRAIDERVGDFLVARLRQLPTVRAVRSIRKVRHVDEI